MTVTFVHCSPDAESLVVKMARVSNPANEDNVATASKLLRYLIDHQHWSPFQMCSLCVKIHTERDISAQILRHSSFSFQEFSTRYAEAQPLTIPDLRKQDLKNRQNSTDDLDIYINNYYELQIHDLYAKVEDLYDQMIADGVAKECARRILPLSTQTTLYMHGTLRSWIHYINVRTDPGTQLEHRLIAEDCKQIFIEQFPTIGEAAFKGEHAPGPEPLSPAAQAVLDAALTTPLVLGDHTATRSRQIAAAIHALADQVVPESANAVGDNHDDARLLQWMRIRLKLLTIATELEGQ